MTDNNNPISSDEHPQSNPDHSEQADSTSTPTEADDSAKVDSDNAQSSDVSSEQSESTDASVAASPEDTQEKSQPETPFVADTTDSDSGVDPDNAEKLESGDSTQKSDEADTTGDVAESTDSDTKQSEQGEKLQASSDSEKAGKKKRRRKKKKHAAASGEEGEAAAEDGSKKPRKKDTSQSPFARHIAAAGGGKKHVFAVNEVVAGRVVRCEYGAIVVDLFGKALAIADEFEPREIPEIPTSDESEATTSDASEGQDAPADEPSKDSEVAELSASDDAESKAEDVEQNKSVVEEAVASSDQASEETTPQSVETDEATESPDDSAPDSEATDAVQAAAESSEEAQSSDEVAAVEKATAEDGEKEEMQQDDSDDEQNPPPAPPDVGQIFKGRIAAVAESGHVALVNRIINAATVRAKIDKLREDRKRVQGLVFGFNRGGFDVIVEGIRAFCPASGMSLESIDNPKDLVGRKYDFTLPASKGSSKDLIISRRSILEKEHRKKIKELLRSLKPGQKHQGKVTQIRDYGLFVDIGGVEGLVHQSEISYSFGVKPHESASVGDEVDVQVIKVTYPGDQKKESKKDRTTRVDLSIKALLPDPWDTHSGAVGEGSVQIGKVTRTTDFGAFIELAPSIEGLLHISELGRELKHANQALKEGEEVYVVVERADRRSRRISLSKLSSSAIKEFNEGKLIEPGERPKSLQPGARVKVRVDSFEHHGINVRVIGAAGKRGRGYIPSSESGTERGTDLRKKFPVSTELEVKIISVERDGGLRCSIKAIAIDDERRAVKEYRREAAKQGFGTFGDLLRAKLGEVSGE